MWAERERSALKPISVILAPCLASVSPSSIPFPLNRFHPHPLTARAPLPADQPILVSLRSVFCSAARLRIFRTHNHISSGHPEMKIMFKLLMIRPGAEICHKLQARHNDRPISCNLHSGLSSLHRESEVSIRFAHVFGSIHGLRSSFTTFSRVGSRVTVKLWSLCCTGHTWALWKNWHNKALYKFTFFTLLLLFT